jgi:hypothetical protein
MSLTGRNLRRRIQPIAAQAFRACVDPRSLRTIWLRSLSHAFERQARSAASLYLMRKFIDFTIIARRLDNARHRVPLDPGRPREGRRLDRQSMTTQRAARPGPIQDI